MSVSNIEKPFRFEHAHRIDKFTGIRELGFTVDGDFAIRAWTSPPDPDGRGTYTTYLPISTMKYRREHPTQCAYFRKSAKSLVVYDDWGQTYTIRAPAAVLDILVGECIANEVPLRS